MKINIWILTINYVLRPIEVYGINSQNYTDEVMDYEEDYLELSDENTAADYYIEEGKTHTEDDSNNNSETYFKPTLIKAAYNQSL